MIPKKLEDAMNEQLNYELFSSYIYQAMSADFKAKGLNGFANWMQVQVKEELIHAMGFHNYILSRGGKVKLMKIEAPP
ncbi:MAG TPA: ferritin-like domain-containing protein, partial [Victivallales bacterium]|nr:ferritin-like domain-containing protein [Victivallales bacterium]